MKQWQLNSIALLALTLLAGCSTSSSPRQALAEAKADFDAVSKLPAIQQSAEQNLHQADESLTRAERLSHYWGNGREVVHYSYLSSRYSAIAREQGAQSLAGERISGLERERARLELALHESQQLGGEPKGEWLEMQLASLASSEAGRGLVVTLGDVLFDTGRADLKPAATRSLLQVASFLRVNENRAVRIEGYSDNQGDAQQNLELSRARAQSVSAMLVDLGISPQRIQVKGYGDAHPIAENASARGRALNRRVEIVVSDEKGVLGEER